MKVEIVHPPKGLPQRLEINLTKQKDYAREKIRLYKWLIDKMTSFKHLNTEVKLFGWGFVVYAHI